MFRRKPIVPSVPPSWLIVGLGNPGPEYAGTRHNVGFEVVDMLAQRFRIKLDTRRHKAVYGVGLIAGESVVLAKPLTFMNLSGVAVAPLAREFQLAPERVLVVADDLDLDIGRTRMKPKGGAGGHNGHKSLIASLGTGDYPRIRIGIGKGKPGDTIDHVLSRFAPGERELIEDAKERAADGIETMVREGLERALTAINTRQQGEAPDDSDG